MKKSIIFLLLIFSLIFVDQLSKYKIRQSGGFYICNKGIAFGLNVPSVFLWTLIIILFALAMSNWKFVISNLGIKKNPSDQLPITNYGQYLTGYGIIFVFAGALSNILDRLYFDCVIDFIDLKFWAVFNIADIFIVTGVIIILASMLKKKVA